MSIEQEAINMNAATSMTSNKKKVARQTQHMNATEEAILDCQETQERQGPGPNPHVLRVDGQGRTRPLYSVIANQ